MPRHYSDLQTLDHLVSNLALAIPLLTSAPLFFDLLDQWSGKLLFVKENRFRRRSNLVDNLNARELSVDVSEGLERRLFCYPLGGYPSVASEDVEEVGLGDLGGAR